MKTLILSASAAAFAVLVATSGPALAGPGSQKPSATSCEPAPQFGPRAPLRAPVCTKPGERKAHTGMGGPVCDPSRTGTTGHYVWRPRPQAGGPRAPLQAPERVWIEAC